MDWREAAAGGLPAPRDDEPASLRQDILDELADHLDCALQRELTKNITADEAIDNVKRRFGEPRELARSLWFDAMRDTIMSKRLTLAAMAMMTLMCLLSGWIAWSAHRASQNAAESITQANGALISKLSTLLAARPAQVGNSGPERADVHFHLIGDDAQKSPAQGYEGKLFLAGSGAALNPLVRSSDEQGNLNFGILPAGSYILRVTTPWSEFASIPVEVSPSFPITAPIICPTKDWQPADVEFEYTGLPSLRDRDALIVLHIWASSSRAVGPSYSWTQTAHNRHAQNAYDVVLDPSGHLVYFSESAVQGMSWQAIGSAILCWGGSRVGNRPAFQLLSPTDRFSWLAEALNRKPQLGFSDRLYTIQSMTILLAPDIRRRAGQTAEPGRCPFTLQTWALNRTPYADMTVSPSNLEASPLQPVPGQKNVWKVRFSRTYAELVNQMLLSSASRLPDAKDSVTAKAESATGADLLKTLGIASANSDHTADGLTGLRLGAITDNLPAKYAGLQQGDLLLGVNGWNVNNDRELGAAAAGYPLSAEKARAMTAATSSDEWLSDSISPHALIALVRRGAEMLLFEVKPPGSPAPPVTPVKKSIEAAKPDSDPLVPGSRSRNRRQLGTR